MPVIARNIVMAFQFRSQFGIIAFFARLFL